MKKFCCRFAAAVLCFVLICGAMAGCSNVANMVSGVAAAGEFPVEINGVSVSARPQKAVVLSPSLADVILALGCETQLAASSEECTQDGLQALQKVAKDNAQAVLDLGPDLVLADASSSGAVPALQEAGVTVLVVEPATDREDFERLYAQVSSAFLGGGAGYDSGVKVAQDIFLTLDTINRIVPKEKVTTACYLYDLDGNAVTGDTFGSTVMTYSGVTNVFQSLSGGTYEFDSLRVSNPDLIFCPPGLADQLKSDSRFTNFQAVKSGKVVEMDPSLMELQGRTVIQTAYEISAAAFPELLEENSTLSTDPGAEIDSAVSSALESASEESDTTHYETLQEGDQSEDVLKMQERLDELGYLDTEYDGHYGEYTANCVREFQKANGLEATGIADAETQRKLYSKKAAAKGSGENDPSHSTASAE